MHQIHQYDTGVFLLPWSNIDAKYIMYIYIMYKYIMYK